LTNEDYDNGLGIGVDETLEWVLDEITSNFLERDFNLMNEAEQLRGNDLRSNRDRRDELINMCKWIQQSLLSDMFKHKIKKSLSSEIYKVGEN
jgi:hypothetical protein